MFIHGFLIFGQPSLKKSGPPISLPDLLDRQIVNDPVKPAANVSNFLIFNELIKKLENEKIIPEDIEDTMILIPSAELSRARGGFHCMSMPLLRDEID